GGGGRAVVALPELGHTGRSCYGALTPRLLGDPMFRDATVFHIDFPEHIERGVVPPQPLVEADKGQTGETGGASAETDDPDYTIPKLAEDLVAVLADLRLPRCLGLGTGMGAHLLLRAAGAAGGSPGGLFSRLCLVGVPDPAGPRGREWIALHALRVHLDKS
ncbi:unnamed protein product, partial [Heterosigma akashiwo]